MKINIVGEDVVVLNDTDADLEGAFVLSESVAKKVSAAYINLGKYSVNVDFLFDTVCETFSVTKKQLYSKTQKQYVVVARYVIFYILYGTQGFSSYQSVGSIFSRDHATVIHGLSVIDSLISVKDPIYYKSIKFVLDIFKPGTCI